MGNGKCWNVAVETQLIASLRWGMAKCWNKNPKPFLPGCFHLFGIL